MDKSLAVIIPFYNEIEYLERCLSSCVTQKEINEIILIDDGSTDGSESIIEKFEDDRIILLQHGMNLGRAQARNTGIKHAQSKWITFCDADDFYMEDRFSAFANATLSFNIYYDPVYSEFAPGLKFSKKEKWTTIKRKPKDLQSYLIKNREERLSLIGIIVTKDILIKSGMFDPQFTTGEDTDLIWRIAPKCKLLLNNDFSRPRVIRYVHEHNSYRDVSTTNANRLKFYTAWAKRLDKLIISNKAKQRITDSYHYYQQEHKDIDNLFAKVKKEVKNLLGNQGF